jgi:hypothetical protein
MAMISRTIPLAARAEPVPLLSAAWRGEHAMRPRHLGLPLPPAGLDQPCEAGITSSRLLTQLLARP